jgi:hypothetical protein
MTMANKEITTLLNKKECQKLSIKKGRGTVRDGEAYQDQAFKADTTGFILAVVGVNVTGERNIKLYGDMRSRAPDWRGTRASKEDEDGEMIEMMAGVKTEVGGRRPTKPLSVCRHRRLPGPGPSSTG